MKEKIIEILYKAIDNAFAFEVYDGPKSEQDLTKNNEFFADEILQLTQPTEKPSAEEWSIEEAERKFEYLLDQYETYVKYETTPIFLKDSVMEAFMNFWEQYAKQ
jgi:hypothetical protein